MDEFVLGVKAKNSQSKASIHNKVTLLSKHRCRFYITLLQKSNFLSKNSNEKVSFCNFFLGFVILGHFDGSVARSEAELCVLVEFFVNIKSREKICVTL